MGHLYRGRGIDLIIDCAKLMRDVTFHIVGGTNKDLDKWKNLIKQINLPNIFFYGFVSPKNSINYRNSFDILLAPYSKQVSVYGANDLGDTSKFMSPLKIFEYMAHQKAIIASDLPVLREILNSENSILIEPENISALVRAIISFKRKDLREKLGANALKDFKRFTWVNRADRLINKI